MFFFLCNFIRTFFSHYPRTIPYISCNNCYFRITFLCDYPIVAPYFMIFSINPRSPVICSISGIDRIGQNARNCSCFPYIIWSFIFILVMTVQYFCYFDRSIFFLDRQIINISYYFCLFFINDQVFQCPSMFTDFS